MDPPNPENAKNPKKKCIAISQPALQTELGIGQDFRTYVNPPRSKNRNRMVVMV